MIFHNFWATRRKPCREEMLAMQHLWERFWDCGLVILAVAADRSAEDGMRRFASRLGLTFPILLDSAGPVRNRYEVVVLPVMYFIGRDGKLLGRSFAAGQRTHRTSGTSDAETAAIAGC